MINTNKKLKKVMMIGEAGVGKTLLLNQICLGRLPASKTYRPTIGADFLTFRPNDQVTYQVWDTAGQERFSSLGTAFYRGADLFMLVFNVHSKESFEKLESHYKTAMESCDKEDGSSLFMLVGITDQFFEGDQKAQRAVSVEDAEKFAHLHRCMYLETSVISDFNREEVLQKLAEYFAKMEI